MAQCGNCGKTGGMFEVKRYNMPNRQDKILCKACYQKMIRTGEYHSGAQRPQQQEITCFGCNKPISAEFKMCPYCGRQVTSEPPPTASTQETKSCPSCGGSVQAEFKLCPYCGHKIEPKASEMPHIAQVEKKGKFCSSCGKELKVDSKFCGNCGTKIS